MKHLKIYSTSAIILVCSFNALAQSKVAHINTQELVESMPEMKVQNLSLKN